MRSFARRKRLSLWASRASRLCMKLILSGYAQGVTPSAKLSLELCVDVRSVREARHAVDSLQTVSDPEVIFNLRLLVTELVGNSVRHAGLEPGDQITVDFDVDGSRVRVVVSDPGPGVTTLVSEQSRTSGYGLYLVDALADRWGVEPGTAQSSVWFEIDLPEAV
jgi:anti-sigma regulatory factor (Ser/Thr protein kinase)